MRVATLALLTCSLIAGCAEYASGLVFLANSSTLGWEGSVDGIAFKEQGRFEHSGRPQFRIIARTNQPEGNYLLTVNSKVDGTSARITVSRGIAFPAMTTGLSYPDFIEDMNRPGFCGGSTL